MSDLDALVEWLTPIADLLIPAAEGMPSASQAQALTDGLADVLRARPDLGPPLDQARQTAGSLDAEHALELLSDGHPELVTSVQLAIAAAYYSRPRVRRALDYDGQVPVPVNMDDYEQIVSSGLLDPVLERGDRYRQVPTDRTHGATSRRKSHGNLAD